MLKGFLHNTPLNPKKSLHHKHGKPYRVFNPFTQFVLILVDWVDLKFFGSTLNQVKNLGLT